MPYRPRRLHCVGVGLGEGPFFPERDLVLIAPAAEGKADASGLNTDVVERDIYLARCRRGGRPSAPEMKREVRSTAVITEEIKAAVRPQREDDIRDDRVLFLGFHVPPTGKVVQELW